MADEANPNDDNLKQLRKMAEEGKSAQDELAATKRLLMFAKAGIDTDTKLGNMLFKTFEGDSIDALRGEAEEIGLFKQAAPAAPADDDTDDDTDQRAEQQRMRASLTQGRPAGADTPPTANPNDAAYEVFHQTMKSGGRREDAQAMALDVILKAAQAGDTRVLFNEQDWVEGLRS